MIDFTKAGIGQPVSHPAYGDGTITGISIDDFYSIDVTFSNVRVAFTNNGKSMYSDKYPTLCVGHGTAKVNQGKLPKQEYEPRLLVFSGVPKWAYVGDGTYKDAELRGRRHVVAGNSRTSWCAIAAGKANTESSSIAHWDYAWELGDD